MTRIKCDYPIRSKIALSILLLGAALAGISMVRDQELLAPPKVELDLVSQYRTRLEMLRRALPRQGMVGYLGEERSLAESANGQYYMTQYALAPLVLAFNEKNLPLIIGNFHAEATRARVMAELTLYQQTDFGAGVLLFQRRVPNAISTGR